MPPVGGLLWYPRWRLMEAIASRAVPLIDLLAIASIVDVYLDTPSERTIRYRSGLLTPPVIRLIDRT